MKPTLLVMAAGMGSRYGGLKQIDPVGPSGEIIIEYSIYDAIRAGFGKIVFVVRREFEQAFKDAIGSKASSKIDIEYTYQEMDLCIGDHEIPEGREKPWGTGHAILVANGLINEPFAVINADDFYGANAFDLMSEFLTKPDAKDGDYSMVGYELRNTLSDHGSVSRGVCQCDSGNYMQKVVEHTNIERSGAGGICEMEDGTKKELTGDEVVSMNFWGFQPALFNHLDAQFREFLEESGIELKSEFYIPSVVDRLVGESQASVEVLKTNGSWFGVTYQQDKPIVAASIKKLVDAGVYPADLWG